MPDDRKQRGKYLGFVAHEIKNPLSTALWSADLLKRLDSSERAGPRAEKMMDASLRALRRMRRLVEDYFTIERLNDKVLDLRREKAELRPIIEGSIGMLTDKERAEASAWSLDVPKDLTAECDADLLKRALRALVEHVARTGDGPLTLVGRAQPGLATLWMGRPGTLAKMALMPPPPEEQTGGDPDGSVLGFQLALCVISAHGGKLEERDGGLRLELIAA